MSGDGRMFGWQRTLTGVSPVVVWDRAHGCAKMEFVGDLHLMRPEQYRMTVDELVVEYPAPAMSVTDGE